MEKTLTLRISEKQYEALAKQARLLGKSRSEFVRNLIQQALKEQPIGKQAGHLKGSLELSGPKSEWRRQLRQRNWR